MVLAVLQLCVEHEVVEGHVEDSRHLVSRPRVDWLLGRESQVES